jgi:PIN domain nuclease of toxin-antitoxin system
MLVAVIDTHAVIWYLYHDRRLSQRAENLIDAAVEKRQEIGLSSISLAEVVYLVEKGTIPPDTLNSLIAALQDVNSVLVEIPLAREIVQAMPRVPRAAVPDMPDRIIAATALHLNVPIISRDAKIQVSGLQTIW